MITNENALHQLSYEQAVLKARYLAQQWARWQEQHQLLIGGDANDNIVVAAERAHIDLERQVMECTAKIDTLVNLRLQERHPQVVAAAPAAPQPIIVRHHREPKIGQFDGKYENWASFFDLFRVEVDSREDMDAVEKLVHLKAACVEKSARALGDWPITAANYPLAWAALQEKFNNRYIAKKRLVSELHRMPRQKVETYYGLRALIDTPKIAMRQLEALGENVGAWDLQVSNLILFRAPEAVIEAWEKEREVEEPTLAQLYAWLEKRARIQMVTETMQADRAKHQASMRECNQNGNRSQGHSAKQDSGQRARPDNNPQQGGKQNSGQHPNARGPSTDGQHKGKSFAGPGPSRPPMKCWVCNDHHSIYACRTLLSKNVSERRQLLLDKGVCLECGIRHAGTCRAPRRCLLCDDANHTDLVCPKRVNRAAAGTNNSNDRKRANDQA